MRTKLGDERERGALGRRIRWLRFQHCPNMGDLAHKTGMNARYLYRLEEGKAEPSWWTMCRLADALGIPIEEFRYQ